ncbi:MAG: glycoside hydrolase family 9 protein [Fibrobacteres bacterium]|nr:glycoside hydrolase family 9 protein [Fibrobacterota bacterium]
MKALISGILGLGLLTAQAADPVGKFTAEQYKKALWMTTRYFGAVRSGTGPNWATQDSKWPTSFVKDSYKGKDVSGGWFDCGDHVMFGQTQFYAAYILAKGYATWKAGFPDAYSGDFSDYKASQDYSMAGGSPNGIPDILDELRYEADWFVKITSSPTDFVHQKGEGPADHTWWFHSGRMSSMPVSQGGEKDGSRKILGGSDMNDGNMPGQCAAMLAVMARVDPDPVRREAYLAGAKNAYAYSKTKDGTAGSSGFYTANYGVLDARLNAATELWLTTGDGQYKTEALAIANNGSFTFNSYWRLDYENDEAIAMLNAKYVLGVNLGTAEKRDIEKYLKDVWASAPTGVTTKNKGGFPLRGISGYSFLTGLYSQFTKDRSHDQFIVNQVDYMLGDNGSNQSYLVGWDESGKKMPTTPHIRNYYLNEDSLKNTPGAVASPAKMKYLGAMVGGELDGSYKNDILNLSMNEPCAELNAPVVASIGFVVSRLAPVDTNISAIRTERHAARGLPWRWDGNAIVVPASGFDRPEIRDVSGQTVGSFRRVGDRWHWDRKGMTGIVIASAQVAGQRVSSRIALP